MRYPLLSPLLFTLIGNPLAAQEKQFTVAESSSGLGYLVCYEAPSSRSTYPSEQKALVRRIEILLDRYNLSCPEFRRHADGT